MSNQMIAIFLAVACASNARAQQAINANELADAFSVNNFLFVYSRDDLLAEDHKAVALEDVTKPIDIQDAASPKFETEDLIDSTLGYHNGYHLEQMVLKDFGSRGFYWSVTWSLYPSPGGSTGIPWLYRTWLTGDGLVIAPRVYLWDASYFQYESWIRCYLALDDLKVADGARILQGDEIRKAAKRYLDEFLKKQGEVPRPA